MLQIDAIERELVLPASPSVAWEKSFGSPSALSSWFPERVEGEFATGASFFLIWGEHRCEARLVEFVPGQVLAYQWHPGDALMIADRPENELTTVRFTLAPHEKGTLVRMVENGFSNIDVSRREYALGQNTGGWDEELAKLPKGYAA